MKKLSIILLTLVISIPCFARGGGHSYGHAHSSNFRGLKVHNHKNSYHIYSAGDKTKTITSNLKYIGIN